MNFEDHYSRGMISEENELEPAEGIYFLEHCALHSERFDFSRSLKIIELYAGDVEFFHSFLSLARKLSRYRNCLKEVLMPKEHCILL